MDNETYNKLKKSSNDFKNMDDNFEDASKQRLAKLIETKIRTTFIGCISKFEEGFGDLWGHGKREDELTDSEANYAELWEFVRTNILNHGNNQLRAAHNEIEQYKISWNRHTVKMKKGNN